MTSVESADVEQSDVRTIIIAGVKLGVMTALGVVVFSILSRLLEGTLEMVVQSILIVVGGIVFSYFGAVTIRPRDVDSIAWASLIGLLGALVFTVIDTAALRPLGVYHWTWDQIGGGSGFWYIPVWWMGAAVLAWLGAWGFSRAEVAGRASAVVLSGQTVVISIVLFAVLGFILGPATAAMMALCFALALIVQLLFAAVIARK
ncbi:MAG: hypothetical protein P8X82_06500 [Gemmatimonadales bacterium]|jgi:hypothetical protein